MVGDNAILVIDTDAKRAAELKAMIEFLDSPNVILGTPTDWQKTAAEQTLHAVFVGNGLTPEQVEALHVQLEEHCAGTPVVTVEQEL